jgi:DNA (cytosine-5)-methyltransferase 1
MTNGFKVIENYKIRRLTPRECFRLMDFPDTFDFSCVSDSQAYKQAGNSIVVRVLEKIIKNLSL